MKWIFFCRTIPLGNATPENIEKMTTYPGQVIYRCPRCLSIKPQRAHHCSVCKRCVKKMVSFIEIKLNGIEF